MPAETSPRASEPRIPVLVMLGAGAALGLIVSIAVFVAMSLVGDDPAYPPGYFGDMQRLTQEAQADLGRIAPARVLQDCLDGSAAACENHAGQIAQAAERMRLFAETVAALRPPQAARAWHGEYEDALARLTTAFQDQDRALRARDPDAFGRAVRATQAAAAEEQALADEFNRRFADQLS